MEKYILQILESNSRVIVPEFGAFIVKQKSPLTIVFNEFLQYNDGMLVDTVAKGEGIARDAAKDKIEKFVKEITASLEKSGTYNVEELGLLVKNSAGKISLDSGESDSSVKKPAEKTATPTPKESEDKAEKKEDSKPEPKTVPIAKSTPKSNLRKPLPLVPKSKSAEKTGEQETSSTPPKTEPKPAAKRAMVKPKIEEQKLVEKKEEPTAEVIKEKPAAVKAPEPLKSTFSGSETRKESSIQPEPKRGNKVLLWVAVIVLVNAGIVAYFYYSGNLSGLFQPKEEIEELVPVYEDMTTEGTDENPTMDPMIEEAIEEETEPVPVAPPAQVQRTITTGKRYYIVAGVFSIEDNADNLVLELRSKGYTAEKFGKIGSMHAVSYGVYSSKSEANTVLNQIKAKENPQAWMKVVD